MPRPQPVHLPISLQRSLGIPLATQLADSIRTHIDQGALRAGDLLPATRTLADQYGVARGTAVAAYDQLLAEGYLLAAPGRGTLVRSGAQRQGAQRPPRIPGTQEPPLPREQRAQRRPSPSPLTDHEQDAAPPTGHPLSPSAPITDTVANPAWRSAWRHAAGEAAEATEPQGSPELRAQLAEHLRRMRGVQVDANRIFVTAGAREGLALALHALGAGPGKQLVVGVEDPGYPALRAVAARMGAEVVALPVDAEGLDTDRLPGAGLDAVIVTPSHQYPLGGALPIARRRALLSWAETHGVLVIEDDFDAELRFEGTPLPPLAALDQSRGGVVLTLGTLSKVLTPALATGYILSPPAFLPLLLRVRDDLGCPVPAIAQAALARYLASGELRKHTARMRRRYRARALMVRESLGSLPGITVVGMGGGLHAAVTVQSDFPREKLEPGLALGAHALSEYWQGRDGTNQTRGLVLGYGGPDEARYQDALKTVAAALTAPVPGPAEAD